MRPLLVASALLSAICILGAPAIVSQVIAPTWYVAPAYPTYFVGDTMWITVIGPNNTYFTLTISNSTGFPVDFTGGSTGPLSNVTIRYTWGIDKYEEAPGWYVMTVAVDGENVTSAMVEAVYNEDYIHDLRHEEIVDFMNQQGAVNQYVNGKLLVIERELEKGKWRDFLTMLGVVVLFVYTIPNSMIYSFRAYSDRSTRGSRLREWFKMSTFWRDGNWWHQTNLSDTQARETRKANREAWAELSKDPTLTRDEMAVLYRHWEGVNDPSMTRDAIGTDDFGVPDADKPIGRLGCFSAWLGDNAWMQYKRVRKLAKWRRP